MLRRVTLVVVAFIYVGVACRELYAAPCENPDDVIDRVYVQLNFPFDDVLEGSVLRADFGGGRKPQLLSPSRPGEPWSFDLSNSNRDDLVPTALNALTIKPSLSGGWNFERTPGTGPKGKIENVGGNRKCAVYLTFDAVRMWQVRVTADPEADNPIRISCSNNICEEDAKTVVTTKVLPLRERIQMTAHFSADCTAPISLTSAEKLPKTFSVDQLRELTSSSCGGWRGIFGPAPKIPRRGLTVTLVP